MKVEGKVPSKGAVEHERGERYIKILPGDDE
jgi:hypothetical protein